MGAELRDTTGSQSIHFFSGTKKKANKEWSHAQGTEGNGVFFLHSLAPVRTGKLGHSPVSIPQSSPVPPSLYYFKTSHQ